MKRLLSWLLLPILLLAPCVGNAGQWAAGQSNKVKKDPILAGALSWYVPGLGQLYSEAYLKGAIFWVVEESLLFGTVMSFADLKLDITRAFDLGLIIKSKETPNKKEQQKALLLGISLITVHFLNVVDAVNTTLRFNRSLNTEVKLQYGYDIKAKRYNVGVSTTF